MESVNTVLRSAQPGLLYMPTHGAHVTAWLAEQTQREQVLAALRELARRRPDGRAIVAVNAKLWHEWTGRLPGGAPPADPLLAEDPHFRDSGADLFVFLKADDETALDSLLADLEASLGSLLAKRMIVRGSLPHGGKILDRHDIDGITSASDPATVARRVLRDDADGSGGCWLLAQQFRIAWTAFSDLDIDAQEDVIGRDERANVIPEQDIRSHIKRVRILAEDHSNEELLRQAMPYGEGDAPGREEGINFVGLARDANTFERMLTRMIGGPEGDSDRLLGIVQGIAGGYFYVPSAHELELAQGLEPEDCIPAPLWNVRSPNGLMFYNSADYLSVMGGGRYGPGDPPSPRILSLLGKVFARWQNKWYEPSSPPRVPPLADFLDQDEEKFLKAPVAVRRGLTFERMLTRVWTTAEYPVSRDSLAWRSDVFRVDPEDVLVGVMPELSLGRGKEVMPYLSDEERLAGFLVLLDETSSMGHVVPDHGKLLRRGLGEILAEVREREAAAKGSDEQAFFAGAALALEGIQGYCRNYALLATRMADDDEQGRERLLALAARMERLTTEPPQTFVEAVQVIFTLHCCLHLVGEPVSIGRLDQLLIDYLDRADSEEQAQETIDALWVKLGEKAIHNRQAATDHVTYGTTTVSYAGGNFPQGDGINQWVQQVTLGGWLPTDEQEPTPGANRVTLLCLRAARRLPLNAPVVSLRVYPGLDEEIVAEAARAVISGGSHPILFQEERMVRALHRSSRLPTAAARDYACDGCYEPMVVGASEFAFGNVVLLDPLEMALNEGARFNLSGPVYLRGWKVGVRSEPAAEIADFDQLRAIYLAHLRYLVTQFFTGVLGNYGSLWGYCPSPMLSVFIEGCVESGRDLSNGGARFHLLAPMFLAAATTIDALHAIDKLVFDRRTAVTTLPDLVEALRSDWGHAMSEPFQSTLAGRLRADEDAKRWQWLRRQALALPRFGSGDPAVDEIGDWLVRETCRIAEETLADPPPPLATILERLRKQYSLPERPWEPTLQVGVGTFEAYVGDALQSAASADGRRAAQPFPSDFSPAPIPQDLPPISQDRDAAAAVPGAYRPVYTALSSWNRDAANHGLSNAGPIDLNIREDFPIGDIEELIRRYAAGEVGGNLLTLTCADPDTYAAAAAEPERYELVRVRTGGWTEYLSAMFPAHHDQHRRRPYVVPESPATPAS